MWHPEYPSIRVITMSTPPTKTTDEQVEQLAQRMTQLEDRVETLENEKEQLQDENDTLRSAVASLEQNNKALRDTVDEMSDTIEELQQDTMLLESRLDSTVEGLDAAEDDIEQIQNKAERKYADLAHRFSQLEDTLEMDVVEISATGGSSGDTVIEQFASLPEEVKEDQLKDSMRRATVVFEKFMDWADFTQRGYVLKSSELRKLLSTAYDDEFQWSQIYRVMEAFEEGTPAEFEYKETERHGKVLVKHHDITEARANAANNVVSGD